VTMKNMVLPVNLSCAHAVISNAILGKFALKRASLQLQNDSNQRLI